MESSEGVLLFFFIGALISGGIGAIIGSSVEKGVVGLFLGAFLGPIGWIIVLLLPRDSVQQTHAFSSSIASKGNKTQVLEAPATRDLADDAYKLYLAEKYGIKRNDAFQKFVCDNTMFDSMDIALAHASQLEDEALKAQEQEKSEREAQAHRDAKARQKADDDFVDRIYLFICSVIIIGGAVLLISEIG